MGIKSVLSTGPKPEKYMTEAIAAVSLLLAMALKYED